MRLLNKRQILQAGLIKYNTPAGTSEDKATIYKIWTPFTHAKQVRHVSRPSKKQTHTTGESRKCLSKDATEQQSLTKLNQRPDEHTDKNIYEETYKDNKAVGSSTTVKNGKITKHSTIREHHPRQQEELESEKSHKHLYRNLVQASRATSPPKSIKIRKFKSPQKAAMKERKGEASKARISSKSKQRKSPTFTTKQENDMKPRLGASRYSPRNATLYNKIAPSIAASGGDRGAWSHSKTEGKKPITNHQKHNEIKEKAGDFYLRHFSKLVLEKDVVIQELLDSENFNYTQDLNQINNEITKQTNRKCTKFEDVLFPNIAQKTHLQQIRDEQFALKMKKVIEQVQKRLEEKSELQNIEAPKNQSAENENASDTSKEASPKQHLISFFAQRRRKKLETEMNSKCINPGNDKQIAPSQDIKSSNNCKNNSKSSENKEKPLVGIIKFCKIMEQTKDFEEESAKEAENSGESKEESNNELEQLNTQTNKTQTKRRKTIRKIRTKRKRIKKEKRHTSPFVDVYFPGYKPETANVLGMTQPTKPIHAKSTGDFVSCLVGRENSDQSLLTENSLVTPNLWSLLCQDQVMTEVKQELQQRGYEVLRELTRARNANCLNILAGNSNSSISPVEITTYRKPYSKFTSSSIKVTGCKNSKRYSQRELKLVPQHTHLLNLLHRFETSKWMYQVSEHCTWPTLASLIGLTDSGIDHKTFDVSQVEWTGLDESICNSLFAQIVLAISFLHKQSILHGDLNCFNVLVSENHRVKLAGYGPSCQRFIGTSRNDNYFDYTQSSFFDCYTPPELFSWRDQWTKASDIWTMGITLLQMTIGEIPRDAIRFGGTVRFIDRHFPGKIGYQLGMLIDKLLQLKPSMRLNICQVIDHPWLSCSNLLSKCLSDDCHKPTVKRTDGKSFPLPKRVQKQRKYPESFYNFSSESSRSSRTSTPPNKTKLCFDELNSPTSDCSHEQSLSPDCHQYLNDVVQYTPVGTTQRSPSPNLVENHNKGNTEKSLRILDHNKLFDVIDCF